MTQRKSNWGSAKGGLYRSTPLLMAEKHTADPEPARLPNLERSRTLARAAARVAIESGGRDITILDMTGLTALFDYFVIVSGTSQRQLMAMSEDIQHVLEKDLRDRRLSLDGQNSGKWIVLDYGSVVIHLFDDDTRQFYSLEALWADAPNVTAALGVAAERTA
jgi:ribosome-associated protein